MRKIGITLVMVGIIIGGLVVSCYELPPKRKKIELSDGYYISRWYGDTRALVQPNRAVLVMPSIIQASDNKKYIIGLRAKKDLRLTWLGDNTINQPYGYFIYNKQTEALQLGLSRAQLDQYLKEHNIDLSLDAPPPTD